MTNGGPRGVWQLSEIAADAPPNTDSCRLYDVGAFVALYHRHQTYVALYNRLDGGLPSWL